MDSSIESKDMSFVDIFVLFADVDMSSLVLFTDVTLLVLLVKAPLSVALADKTLAVPHVDVLALSAVVVNMVLVTLIGVALMVAFVSQIGVGSRDCFWTSVTLRC